MKKRRKSIWGFTILELIIVVVLMGLLAGLSIPNYTATKERNIEKAAFRSLMIIKQAIRLYLFREELTVIPDLADYEAINIELEISLYDIEGITIACAGAGIEGPNECTARRQDSWSLRFHDDARTNIYCSGGDCPTCNADGNAPSAGCSRLE